MDGMDLSQFRRDLKSDQTCIVYVHDVASGVSTEVYRTRDILLEAPNWTKDDDLILNGDFVLWRLALSDGTLSPIAAEGLPPLNNDHVLAPNDHSVIYVSGYDFHIHRLDMKSGVHSRVTHPVEDARALYFLHGVSPANDAIAFVGMMLGKEAPWSAANIYVQDLASGAARPITSSSAPADGCEYAPEGDWIYLNTEQFSTIAGHAQIARCRPDGSDLQQLTFDDRVNWFPHIAPRGGLACYLSYPAGTEGHPADLPVELKLVRGGAWDQAETVAQLMGGQGTINVNSWSPCGTRFAYVAYPFD